MRMIARMILTTRCYLLPIRRPQNSTPRHAGVRGCMERGHWTGSEPLSFSKAPRESGQKRPLLNSVHTYFYG